MTHSWIGKIGKKTTRLGLESAQLCSQKKVQNWVGNPNRARHQTAGQRGRPVVARPWVFHVSRKAAGRTQWVAHTRRRSRRRRESRDTHASGGSQSPVESTPTRLQIHRTGWRIGGDSTRISKENPHPPVDSIGGSIWGASDGLRDDVRAALLRLARAQSARQDGEEGAQPPQVSVPITPQAAPHFPNSAAPHFPVTLAFSRRDATRRLSEIRVSQPRIRAPSLTAPIVSTSSQAIARLHRRRGRARGHPRLRRPRPVHAEQPPRPRNLQG